MSRDSSSHDTSSPDGADAGPSCDASVDSDDDGLDDCRERALQTDPNDADTDGDGLTDGREVDELGTAPRNTDTDGDSVDDGDELELGLDPTASDSFGDGTRDDERAYVKKCLNDHTSQSFTNTSRNGEYRLVLPTSFTNYKQIHFDSSSTKGLGVFSDSTNDVHGFVFSNPKNPPVWRPEIVLGQLPRDLENSSSPSMTLKRKGWSPETYESTNGSLLGQAEWVLTFDSAQKAEEVRRHVMFGSPDLSESDVYMSTLPEKDGGAHTEWTVRLSVFLRDSNAPRRFIVGAVAPRSAVANNPGIDRRLTVAADRGAVSEQGATTTVRCQGYQPRSERPKAYLYWVLDQSDNMTAYADHHRDKLLNLPKPTISRLQNTYLEYRLGVTNMDRKNEGKLGVPPGWHTSKSTFESEIKKRVLDCDSTSSWECADFDEYGFESAKNGLEHMLGDTATPPGPDENIDSGSEIFTFFMSSEDDNSSETSQRQYGTYLHKNSEVFAMVGDGESCGQGDGAAYRELASGSGGGFESLCSDDYDQLLSDFVDRAAASSSPYRPQKNPIRASIHVYVQGKEVPNDRSSGWAYLPEEGGITFFGGTGPGVTANGNGEYVTVVYETH